MSKYEEELAKLNLSQEGLASQNNWIEDKIKARPDKTKEEIENLWLTRLEECLKAMNPSDFSEQDFIWFVQSMVAGDLATDVPEYDVPVFIMPIGLSPLNSDFKTKEPKLSLLAYSSVKENPNMLRRTIIYLKGKDELFKVNDIHFFKIYDTSISAPEIVVGSKDILTCKINKKTEFRQNIVETAPGFQISEKDRIEFFRKIDCVSVRLMNAGDKLTQLKKPEGFAKPFPNIFDLREILVNLVKVDIGMRDDRSEFVRMGVVDSSFNSTQEHKDFTVWANADLVRKVGAGPASQVRIMGVLKYDSMKKVVMDAYQIIPIIRKPLNLQEMAPNLSGEPQGVISYPINMNA